MFWWAAISPNHANFEEPPRTKKWCLRNQKVQFTTLFINPTKTTLIIGDMNICNRENPNNKLRTYLEANTFKLIVQKPTHIGGGHIDHAYLMNKGNFSEEPNIELCPKYYSDHDALYVSLKKVERINLRMSR